MPECGVEKASKKSPQGTPRGSLANGPFSSIKTDACKAPNPSGFSLSDGTKGRVWLARQAENPAAEGSVLVEEASIAGLRPTSSASNEAREFESSGDMSPEKVVVVLGAYAHREPNVSSAIDKLYPIGTELELLSRSDGWAYIRNPISKQTGWVLEQHYLTPVRTPGPKQVVKLEAQTPKAGPSSVSTKQTRKAAAEKSYPHQREGLQRLPISLVPNKAPLE